MPKLKTTTSSKVAGISQQKSKPAKNAPSDTKKMSAEQIEKTRATIRDKLRQVLVDRQNSELNKDGQIVFKNVLENNDKKTEKDNRALASGEQRDGETTSNKKISSADSSFNTDNEKADKPRIIAKAIEDTMFDVHHNIDSEYKTEFRRLWTSLKDDKTRFASMLLHDEISPERFAMSSLEELLPESRRLSDASIKQEAIRRCTISEILPSDIAALKDGRENTKWGLGKSAASID